MGSVTYKGQSDFNGHDLFTSYFFLWVNGCFFQSGMPQINDAYILRSTDQRFASAFERLGRHLARTLAPTETPGVFLYLPEFDQTIRFLFQVAIGQNIITVQLIRTEEKISP